MEKRTVILASQSPRRLELLEKLGWNIITIKPEIAEVLPENEISYTDAAEYLAQIKAEHIYENASFDRSIPIIAADTIVVHKGEILGKPIDSQNAFEMLTVLSGSQHSVVTGVCIMNDKNKISFSCETHVTFGELQPDAIAHYIESGAPMDKAGAYGIQDWIGLIGIEKIEGDYYNVMGLPVYEVWDKIKRF